MSFLGIVRSGHVELPPGVRLPDGTEVRVEVSDDRDPLDHLEDFAMDLGPPDLASRLDWYLYGIDKSDK